jgi:hypothetical protein
VVTEERDPNEGLADELRRSSRGSVQTAEIEDVPESRLVEQTYALSPRNPRIIRNRCIGLWGFSDVAVAAR